MYYVAETSLKVRGKRKSEDKGKRSLFKKFQFVLMIF